MTDYKHLKLKRWPTAEQWIGGGGFISTLAFILFILPMLLPFARLS